MKTRFMALLVALVMILSVATVAMAEDVTVYDVDWLNCWNGSSANWPDDLNATAAGKYVLENFGLNFNTADTAGQSEYDYINLLFSSGSVPDVVSSPYWGIGSGQEGQVALDGAIEGMVKDLTPYLDNYPNLKALFEKENGYLATSYRMNMMNNDEFDAEDKVFFLPTGVNMNSEEFSSVYGDTLYVRADIAEALGVDPESITNTDELVDFLRLVAESDITDWNGNKIIPLGTGHDGWRNANIFSWFRGNNISNWRQLEDGSVTYYLFTDYVENRIALMRTLFSENLIDQECLTQSDETASSKVANGQYAVISVDANAVTNQYYYGSLGISDAHPEANWLPLGLKNLDGNNSVDVYTPGFSGGNITWFSADISDEKLNAVLTFMDWLCSEEGQAFNWYGVEGETYVRDEQGRPVYTDDVQAAIDADSSAKTKTYGIERFNNLACYDQRETNWAKTDDELTAQELAYRQMQNYFRPRVEVDAVSVENLLKQWDGYTDLTDGLNILDAGTQMVNAYYYETWEEVEAMIADLRQKALDLGIEEAYAYIEENLTDDYAF